MEVHYDWHHDVHIVYDKGVRTAMDMVRFQGNLLRMGFVVAHRDDNPYCKHCTELTLIRVAC